MIWTDITKLPFLEVVPIRTPIMKHACFLRPLSTARVISHIVVYAVPWGGKWSLSLFLNNIFSFHMLKN